MSALKEVVLEDSEDGLGKAKYLSSSPKLRGLFPDVDPLADHVVSYHEQDQLPIISQLSGPGRFGSFPFQQSLLTHDFVLALPFGQTLAWTTVYSLLLKLLPYFEVDFGGPDRGGGFNVERLVLLLDLHGWFGGGGHRDLPEHHVDSKRLQQLLEIFRIFHLPAPGEVGHLWVKCQDHTARRNGYRGVRDPCGEELESAPVA